MATTVETIVCENQPKVSIRRDAAAGEVGVHVSDFAGTKDVFVSIGFWSPKSVSIITSRCGQKPHSTRILANRMEEYRKALLDGSASVTTKRLGDIDEVVIRTRNENGDILMLDVYEYDIVVYLWADGKETLEAWLDY